jgi:hypothetical protein
MWNLVCLHDTRIVVADSSVGVVMAERKENCAAIEHRIETSEEEKGGERAFKLRH